jgi:hypothetical protein
VGRAVGAERKAEEDVAPPGAAAGRVARRRGRSALSPWAGVDELGEVI